MNDYSDKELAVYLLVARQNEGKMGYYKSSCRRWLLFFLSLAIMLGILAFIQLWMVFWLVLGIYVGIFGRDRNIFQGIQASWPFYMRIIDWSKVEQIANEKPSA